MPWKPKVSKGMRIHLRREKAGLIKTPSGKLISVSEALQRINALKSEKKSTEKHSSNYRKKK